MERKHDPQYAPALSLLTELLRAKVILPQKATSDEWDSALRMVLANMFCEGDEDTAVSFILWLARKYSANLPPYGEGIMATLRYLARPACDVQQWRMFKAHLVSLEEGDVEVKNVYERAEVSRVRYEKERSESLRNANDEDISDILSTWRDKMKVV